MKRRDVLIAGAASGVVASAAACRPAPHPGLGRGFHVGNVLRRSLADFQRMAADGASLVRFGIELVVDPSGQRYEPLPLALPELMRQLDFARASGLKYVPVLRPPPEPESPLWASAALQASLVEHWRRLAQQLAGRPEVAAFNLINEPHPPGNTFSIKQARSDALAERLIRGIRAVDPARKIVLEPSPGARPMAFRTATLLPFENLIYSVHMYEPFEFTHQRVGDPRFTGVVDYPGLIPGQGVWNRERLLADLAPVRQFEQQHGVEIFVGEFGAPRWAPNAARVRYLRDLLDIFNTWGWSWTYHGWREWHGWDAEMGADETQHERRATEPAYQLLRDALNACTGAGGR